MSDGYIKDFVTIATCPYCHNTFTLYPDHVYRFNGKPVDYYKCLQALRKQEAEKKLQKNVLKKANITTKNNTCKEVRAVADVNGDKISYYFPSIGMAARALGVSSATVSTSIKHSKRVKNLSLSFVEDLQNEK